MCSEYTICKYILLLFNIIFKHAVIPNQFNMTHIIPIIKDHKKPNNSIDNLRPISISNTLVQIFERILLSKMPIILDTHSHQFGYKKKISCTHALFAYKETIISYIENNKDCCSVSLDAVKAFDCAWREAIFYKLKLKGIDRNLIIILRMYYDNLQSKIKNNNQFSIILKLNRGVKQGGVISPFLFNILIDDLIKDCYNSNYGAKMNNVMMNVFGFCDDINLLSETIYDLQELLKICELYGNEWAIDYNLSKCFFMAFGKARQKYIKSKVFLNNVELKHTDLMKYRGIIFSYNLNMSNFY